MSAINSGTALVPSIRVVEHFTGPELALGYDIFNELVYQIFHNNVRISKEKAASTSSSQAEFMPFDKFSEKLLLLQAKILRCHPQTNATGHAKSVITTVELSGNAIELEDSEFDTKEDIERLFLQINTLFNQQKKYEAIRLLFTSSIFQDFTAHRLNREVVWSRLYVSNTIIRIQQEGCAEDDVKLLVDILHCSDTHRDCIRHTLRTLSEFETKELKDLYIVAKKMQFIKGTMKVLEGSSTPIPADAKAGEVFEGFLNACEPFFTIFKKIQDCTCCDANFGAYLREIRPKVIELMDGRKLQELEELVKVHIAAFRWCKKMDEKEYIANQNFIRDGLTNEELGFGKQLTELDGKIMDYILKNLPIIFGSFPFISVCRKVLAAPSVTDKLWWLEFADKPTLDPNSFAIFERSLQNLKVQRILLKPIVDGKHKHGEAYMSLLKIELQILLESLQKTKMTLQVATA